MNGFKQLKRNIGINGKIHIKIHVNGTQTEMMYIRRIEKVYMTHRIFYS